MPTAPETRRTTVLVLGDARNNGNGIYLTDEHDQIVTQIGGSEDRMRSTSEGFSSAPGPG